MVQPLVLTLLTAQDLRLSARLQEPAVTTSVLPLPLSLWTTAHGAGHQNPAAKLLLVQPACAVQPGPLCAEGSLPLPWSTALCLRVAVVERGGREVGEGGPLRLHFYSVSTLSGGKTPRRAVQAELQRDTPGSPNFSENRRRKFKLPQSAPPPENPSHHGESRGLVQKVEAEVQKARRLEGEK